MKGSEEPPFGEAHGIGTGDDQVIEGADVDEGEFATINDTTRKGFTEHEMLDSTELVHMNGRVFDPVIGRFVSADPSLPRSLGTQNANRYAYVGNRGLTLKDPTGHIPCNPYEPEMFGCAGSARMWGDYCAPMMAGGLQFCYGNGLGFFNQPYDVFTRTSTERPLPFEPEPGPPPAYEEPPADTI